MKLVHFVREHITFGKTMFAITILIVIMSFNLQLTVEVSQPNQENSQSYNVSFALSEQVLTKH
jgi:hypothetical protein